MITYRISYVHHFKSHLCSAKKKKKCHKRILKLFDMENFVHTGVYFYTLLQSFFGGEEIVFNIYMY